jgi:epothilone polyketide synthase D
VLETIPRELPLRGVIHAAGVLDDGLLAEQTPERFERVMAPKVVGASHLDALTRDADLDFFVLFSSVAGTLGSAGQAPYAAANAFLDALAVQRRAHGLPAQSLAWGLWADSSDQAAGLASGLTRTQQARWTRSGLRAVSSSEGIALFASALERPEGQLVPVPIDLRAAAKAFGGTVPPLWRGLVRSSSRATSARRGWAEEVAQLSPRDRFAVVLDAVRAEAARVLSLSGRDAVPADRPFEELGLDSLMGVELRNALGKRAGTTLPATLAFDHPTAAAVARYLIEGVFGLGDAISIRKADAASLRRLAESVAHLSEEEIITELQLEAAEASDLP